MLCRVLNLIFVHFKIQYSLCGVLHLIYIHFTILAASGLQWKGEEGQTGCVGGRSLPLAVELPPGWLVGPEAIVGGS